MRDLRKEPLLIFSGFWSTFRLYLWKGSAFSGSLVTKTSYRRKFKPSTGKHSLTKSLRTSIPQLTLTLSSQPNTMSPSPCELPLDVGLCCRRWYTDAHNRRRWAILLLQMYALSFRRLTSVQWRPRSTKRWFLTDRMKQKVKWPSMLSTSAEATSCVHKITDGFATDL